MDCPAFIAFPHPWGGSNEHTVDCDQPQGHDADGMFPHHDTTAVYRYTGPDEPQKSGDDQTTIIHITWPSRPDERNPT